MSVFIFLSAPTTHAQSVLDIPPKIPYPDMTLVGDEVGAKHFRTSMPSPIVSGIAPNDTLVLDIYAPSEPKGPSPAVIILHYWGAADHRIEIGSALELARRGVVGIVMSLPYHMERTPAGFRSGELAISPEPKKLTATMIQSIQDIKRIVDWIQAQPTFRHDRIGITGSSLGAIVASLAVGVEPRLTDAAFVVGGVDLANVLWNSSRVVKERDILRREGYTESTLRATLVPIEPLTYIKSSRLQNVYIIGAKYDTVIPGESTKKLISAVDHPAVHWLDTGHYGGFFIQKRIQNSVGLFFSKAFANLSFDPPTNLNAPTIRLAVTYEPDDGAQIGAGVDLLRPNRPRDPFACVIVSPRGIKGIVGLTLDKGYAIGAFLKPDGIAIGVMWSIVL